MRVIAPLGVLLPPGVSLRIDDADAGRLSFLQCLPNGCVAQLAMDERPDRQAEEWKDRDARHLSDARAGRRHAGAARRFQGGLRAIALKASSGVSTALSFKRIPAAQLSKSDAMIVRATHVRIALFSTALGVVAGCSTVGSVGNSVGGFFSHQDPNVSTLNAGANPRPVAGQPATNPSDKPKVLPVASQDINCPEVDNRRQRRGAARRRPGQRFGALSVQHRRHGARMRSRRPLASRASRLA